LKQLLLIVLFSLIFLYNIDSFAEINNEILLLEKDAMEMIDESKFDEALFNLDRILDIDPKNISALNNKGGILVELGNYTDSINVFNKILRINENNTEALNNKAIALSKLNLYVPALQLFYKSLSLDPSNENTFNNTRTVADNSPWVLESKNGTGVVQIRDHNGNLVLYSKIPKILVQQPLGYILLKNLGTLEEVEIDGVKHQLLKFSSSLTSTRNHYAGGADIYLEMGEFRINAVEFLVNGFISIADDKIHYELIIFDSKYLN